MRIGGIWRYHIASRWRAMALLSAITLVMFIGILLLMMPHMADTFSQAIHLGNGEVTITQTELNKPRLNEPFGTTGSIYVAFMLVFAVSSITKDRRYLLSNSVARYEFIAGTFLGSVTMAVLLTAIQYVLDLICRAVTCALGFQISGMAWSAQLILLSTRDYLPSLISQMGNMIALAGFWTLAILLFARWKKTCIALCVLGVLLPVMLTNFLPANWQQWLISNASYVIERVIDFFSEYQWLFLIDVPAWRVLLQQTITGALLYGISYLVIRRLPVRTK